MISSRRLNRRQIFFSASTALLVVFLIAVLYVKGGLTVADHYIYDHFVKWRGPAQLSGKVTLVLMDSRSLMELERKKGSWSRSQIATALENLCDAGAEIIGLDAVLMSPDTEPENDAKLAAAIEECNNVILARALVEGGELMPLPVFQEAMIGDGIINFHPDKEDEVLRRVGFGNLKPIQGEDGQELKVIPTFSLELVRTFLNIDFVFDFSGKDYLTIGSPENLLRLPYPDLLINFPGDFSVYSRLSFVDVVRNRFPKESVEKKIVIIGSVLPTDKDLFTTAYSRFRESEVKAYEKAGTLLEIKKQDFGVACHAHAVETMLQKKFVRRLPGRPVLFLTFLTGIVCLLFYLPRIGILFEILLLCGGMAMVTGISYLTFLHRLLWVDLSPVLLVIAGQFILGITVQKTFDKKKTAMITNLFGKYVSPAVVSDLIRGDIDIDLKGQSREVSVLFSDLRGFTTLSEKLGAETTGLLLNTYFSAMIPIVFKHEGTLDKLIGDAIMAFFGAPVSVEGHPVKAAETALEMLESLERLKAGQNVEGVEKLNVGIGLNTGVVTVGNLGSDQFMDYTIIGDTVNLASRMEGLTKTYEVRIIVSEHIVNKLDDRFQVRELDKVRVKGKESAVILYELMGYKDKLSPEKVSIIEPYSEGLAAFRRMDWETAREKMEETLKSAPDDGPARFYLKRIETCISQPPKDDWDGITRFDHK